MLTVLVTLPPNAAVPPHTHNGAALSAMMLQGTALNQMNSEEPFISTVGEVFYEAPGCHHVRCENYSATEEAKIYVVIVIDEDVVKDGYGAVSVLDADIEEQK
jgi:quercetin dioxygenase-like cupin family protein